MPAAAQGEDQAAGRDEVSVETFEQREQCRRENDVDDPARTEGLLECDCGHESFIGQLMPWRDECDCGDDRRVEKRADHDRRPDGAR